jgi:hypothetical protein
VTSDVLDVLTVQARPWAQLFIRVLLLGTLVSFRFAGVNTEQWGLFG